MWLISLSCVHNKKASLVSNFNTLTQLTNKNLFYFYMKTGDKKGKFQPIPFFRAKSTREWPIF